MASLILLIDEGIMTIFKSRNVLKYVHEMLKDISSSITNNEKSVEIFENIALNMPAHFRVAYILKAILEALVSLGQ